MLKLSEANARKIALLEQEAQKQGKLIEMRNKWGLLLAVGTTVSAFHDLKDKKGNFLYSYDLKEGWNKKLEYFRYTAYDVGLNIYSKREFKSQDSTFQTALQKAENYWNLKKQEWDKSDSVLKECPGVIINQI